MKTMVTKVTERGQISIPAALRDYMELKPGTSLRWDKGRDRLSCVITIVQVEPKKIDARSMIGFARTFRKTRRTEDWMKELREGEQP